MRPSSPILVAAGGLVVSFSLRLAVAVGGPESPPGRTEPEGDAAPRSHAPVVASQVESRATAERPPKRESLPPEDRESKALAPARTSSDPQPIQPRSYPDTPALTGAEERDIYERYGRSDAFELAHELPIVRPLALDWDSYEKALVASGGPIVRESEAELIRRTGSRNRAGQNPLANRGFVALAFRSGDGLEVIPGATSGWSPLTVRASAATLYASACRELGLGPEARSEEPPPRIVEIAEEMATAAQAGQREFWSLIREEVRIRMEQGRHEPRVAAFWADDEFQVWILRAGEDPVLDSVLRDLGHEVETTRERVERLLPR